MARPRGSNLDFSGLLSGTGMRGRVQDADPQSQSTDNSTSLVQCEPGGYSDNIFIDLSEEEKHKFECNICFLVLKDPRQCSNGHLFCATCIITWSLSANSQSRDKCPVCRSPGRYRPDFKTETKLKRKRVVCPVDQCDWRGSLSTYKTHKLEHIKEDINKHTDAVLPPIIVPSTVYRIANGTATTGATDTPDVASQRTRRVDIHDERQRLHQMFEQFYWQLEQRGRNIDNYYQQRERQRQDNLVEVHRLGQRLDEVATDLTSLLGNMNRDQDRYRGYIRDSQSAGESLLHLSLPSPRTTSRARRLSPSALGDNTELGVLSPGPAEIPRLLTPPGPGSSKHNPTTSSRGISVSRSTERPIWTPCPRGQPPNTGTPINTQKVKVKLLSTSENATDNGKRHTQPRASPEPHRSLSRLRTKFKRSNESPTAIQREPTSMSSRALLDSMLTSQGHSRQSLSASSERH